MIPPSQQYILKTLTHFKTPSRLFPFPALPYQAKQTVPSVKPYLQAGSLLGMQVDLIPILSCRDPPQGSLAAQIIYIKNVFICMVKAEIHPTKIPAIDFTTVMPSTCGSLESKFT